MKPIGTLLPRIRDFILLGQSKILRIGLIRKIKAKAQLAKSTSCTFFRAKLPIVPYQNRPRVSDKKSKMYILIQSFIFLKL